MSSGPDIGDRSPDVVFPALAFKSFARDRNDERQMNRRFGFRSARDR